MVMKQSLGILARRLIGFMGALTSQQCADYDNSLGGLLLRET